MLHCLTFQVNFILQAAQMLLKLPYIYIYIYIIIFIGCPMLKVDSLDPQSFVLGSFFLGWGNVGGDKVRKGLN
jgi:hypothetical protein